MAVRQAARHGKGVPLGGDDGAASEHATQSFDMGNRPVREIAERALTDLAVLAVAAGTNELAFWYALADNRRYALHLVGRHHVWRAAPLTMVGSSASRRPAKAATA